MPSSSTARKSSGTAARQGQVPRQRGQQARARQQASAGQQARAGQPARAGRQARAGSQASAGRQARTGSQAPAAEAQGTNTMPSMPGPRIHLPGGTAGNVIWWGGLAAVAAFGIVDWPVAALVAAGTWVAEQHSRQAGRARPGR